MADLYPLLFEPNLHSVVWGGDRLEPWKGLAPSGRPIGEAWEVSAVSSSPSVIANGPWAGRSLPDVIAELPELILGKTVAADNDNELPLLVKFIDAQSDLSIQVHPNDEIAQRRHGKRGKTEMWYVIDAKPGASLYAGLKVKLTPDELMALANGNDPQGRCITDVLARHEVRKGDVFYLPAGRVHAIGGGILLAEVQQASDVTYRIYDYDRPGLDGKPRELHTALAAEAVCYEVLDDYRTLYAEADNRASLCVDSTKFCVRVLDLSAPKHRNLVKYDSMVITLCLKGTCRIRSRVNGAEVTLSEGHACLVPAAIADYDVTPRDGHALLLDAYVNNMDRSMKRRVERFLHLR